MERFARKCSISGVGMNQGWIWFSDLFYTSSEDITLNELIERDWYPDNEIGEYLELAYNDNEIHFTEWEDDDIIEQGFYYTSDGKKINL